VSNSSPAEVPTRRGRRRWIALAVALLLFVGLRAAWCWLQPSELYFSEEYIQLRLAALVWGEDEAWEGLLDEPPSQGLDPERPFDLFDFQYHPHEGGTLVVSLLLVPIVGVTGLGELPVKLLSILLGLATAIAWVGLLRRLHGEEATIPTAWVFACAPVSWVLATSVLHGYHHVQAALFLPLILLALTGTLRASRLRASGWALVAGLIAGLGLWYSSLNLPCLAVIAVGIPICLRHRPLLLPCFAAGVVVGLLPWLGTNDLADLASFGAAGESASGVLGSVVHGDHESRHQLWRGLAYRPALTVLLAPEVTSETLQRPPLLDMATRGAALVGAGVAAAAGWRAWRRGEEEGRLRVLTAGAALATWLGVVAVLTGAGLIDPYQRRISAALAPLLVLLPLGVLALRARRARQVGLGLLAILLGLHLVVTVRAVARDHRPSTRINPWLIHAEPTADLRDRWQVGIAHVSRQEAPHLDAALRSLLPSSTSRGLKEIRALGYALQQRRRCEELEPPPGQLYDARSAQAFGAGIGVVCLGDVPAGREACGKTVEDDRLANACREGVGAAALP
jgi:hypothetical protein